MEPLEPLARAALLVNAGVVQMSAGRRDSSRSFSIEALAALADLDRTDAAGAGGQVAAAIRYNRAFALASSRKMPDAARPSRSWRRFLTSSRSRDSWWPLARERYAQLCRDLGRTAKTEEELAGKKADLRLVSEVELPGDVRVGLTEKLDDVTARLGEGRQGPGRPADQRRPADL